MGKIDLELCCAVGLFGCKNLGISSSHVVLNQWSYGKPSGLQAFTDSENTDFLRILHVRDGISNAPFYEFS